MLKTLLGTFLTFYAASSNADTRMMGSKATLGVALGFCHFFASKKVTKKDLALEKPNHFAFHHRRRKKNSPQRGWWAVGPNDPLGSNSFLLLPPVMQQNGGFSKAARWLLSRSAVATNFKNPVLKTVLPLLFLLPLLCVAQNRPTGKDYAVFFYVTDFQAGLPRLPETKIEAEALQTELSTNFGFVCDPVPNPTKQQMRDKIRAYNAKLTGDDQVLFFFSMHGHYSENGDRGYLIARDGLATDDYGDTWFSYDELRSDLGPCRAQHILLALDACHSGAFGIRNRTVPPKPIFDQKEDCQTKISKTMQYAGRQYCSSGNKTAKTPAKSLFAARLLEALRNGGDGGIVRFADLEYYLGKVESPEPESGFFGTHAPGGNFVFVRKNACAPVADRDGDQVPDRDDKCPDVWGSQPDGCSPVPGEDMAADLEAWRSAKRLNSEIAYRDYLRRFPGGEFKELANTALRKAEAETLQKRDDTAWELATEKDTPEGYQKYLTDWPAGRHAAEATAKIKAPAIPDDGLVRVAGGTFMMGSPTTEAGREDNETQHAITVSDYHIGRYEVTQKLWREIMGSDPPALNFKGCDDCPVESVSWDDVQGFLKKINAKYPGRNYRLPTEAEWEYAARSGQQSAGYLYAGGNSIDDVAWYGYAKADFKTHPVGKKNPNELRLYDMSGNVWEWCSDWDNADYYQNSPSANPTGPTSGSLHVLRGGSWYNDPQNCRAAGRNSYASGFRSSAVGFRLARTQ